MAQASARLALRHDAELLATALPPLLVAAERVAATVAQGVHGRRRVGTGDSFWQFRRYQDGDAVTAIDWRQTAKRQRAYVRQNEWEAAESVWLWRDASPSMHWQSALGGSEKAERATLLLLAVGSLLVRGGERVALLGSGARPAGGRLALDRLTQHLLLDRTVQNEAPQVELPRHAHAVFIGDFLSPLAALELTVKHYAGQGVRGHLLQVLDPAEMDLPYSGRTRFEGPEGEAPYTVGRVETLRPEWRARLARRHDALKALAAQHSWTFALHRTDKSPETALLALWQALAARFES